VYGDCAASCCDLYLKIAHVPFCRNLQSDDYIAGRCFNNHHFVNYYALLQHRVSEGDYVPARFEAELALAALEHLPDQHSAAAMMRTAALWDPKPEEDDAAVPVMRMRSTSPLSPDPTPEPSTLDGTALSTELVAPER
jgi:hypothetical protein